jgi:hypothetical protein
MSAARDLAKLGNQNALKVDTTNTRVGIGSTIPQTSLQVGVAISMYESTGIVSATAFYGDGSALDGVSSAGLGTALSDDTTSPLNKIYYTNTELGINEDTTITVPSGTNIAYTQYQDIVVGDSYDLIISDGDSLIPDILDLDEV